VEAALAHARAAGARTALLEVRQSNRDAQRLYLRLGFALVGQRPGYYSHPEEDALVLARDVRILEQDPTA
jgi:ribosomal-protein-alanine N-acetyltransferase